MRLPREMTHFKIPALAAILIAAVPVSAETLHVPEQFPTIQAAIDFASTGDEIIVAPGIYHETIDLSGKAIELCGSEGPLETTIDGADLSLSVIRCTSGEGPDTHIEGFTITGGEAALGGGMYNVYTSPTVVNCRFIANTAGDGGGMYNFHSDPTVLDCTFRENVADFNGGGAIYNNHGSPTLINCVFQSNTTSHTFGSGGAIYSRENSRPLIDQCYFSDNISLFNGGGMYNLMDSRAVVTNSIFIDNSARRGAGIHNDESDATVINCVIIDNDAEQFGGGVRIFECEPTVINCSFAGNAAYFGGAIAGYYTQAAISNCILWGNSASVGDEIFNSSFSALNIRYCDIKGSGGSAQWDPLFGTDAGGNIDADPLFVDPDNDDYRLLPGSPCIDAADNTAVPEYVTTDIDGNPRFIDDPATEDTGLGEAPIIDMGAYEYQADACPADVTGDGVVDELDLLAVLAAWDQSAAPEDITGDGIVDVLDLLEVLGAWGQCL